MLPQGAASMTEASGQRVFVGIRIAPQIAQQLAEYVGSLPQRAVRLVPVADIHLTLVPPWNEATISGAIEKLAQVAAASAAFTLTFQHIGYGPDLRRPRLVWADCVASDELAALHEALNAIFHSMDKKPFRPHVTLARIRGNGSVLARRHPIDQALALAQRVDSIELFRSPPPGDSGYRVLAAIPFGETRNAPANP
jgi:2'-5' RNA ligase